ncbi:MAG: DUF1343 domain-containing protein [Clostridiales bacterium]|nr:DUF1343 domain-containing protein [Clostridiales bacterium]
MSRAKISAGLDSLGEYASLLRGRRISIMTNPTGVDSKFRSVIDIVHERFNLTALFACEHGIRGDMDAGMKVDSITDERTGAPVYSLYGSTLRMTDEMLSSFDVLIFDMQDVGARFYTYLYSLSYAMDSCAKAGKNIFVLDRPNPLGGNITEGLILDESYGSFVGEYAIPARYGLTIGEYALWVKKHLSLDLDMTVVPLKGWRREYILSDIAYLWISPSPNIPCLESALCYIGTSIFEGTNLSEGRGTTVPFQVVGAPWLNGRKLSSRMNDLEFPGIYFRECSFIPSMSKHKGEVCHGVQLHITDKETSSIFAAGIYLLEEIRLMDPESFEYLGSGEKTHFDRILGSGLYRNGKISARELVKSAADDSAAFALEKREFEIYN